MWCAGVNLDFVNILILYFLAIRVSRLHTKLQLSSLKDKKVRKSVQSAPDFFGPQGFLSPRIWSPHDYNHMQDHMAFSCWAQTCQGPIFGGTKKSRAQMRFGTISVKAKCTDSCHSTQISKHRLDKLMTLLNSKHCIACFYAYRSIFACDIPCQ